MHTDVQPDQALDHQFLIQEYQITSARVDNLTKQIWQTFTIFLGLSGIGFGVFVQADISTPSALLFFLGFSFAVTITLHWWNRVANKWHGNQRVMYARLHEIEALLNLHTNIAIREQDESKVNKDISIREARNDLVIFISFGWNFYVLVQGLLIYVGQDTTAWGPVQSLAVWVVLVLSTALAVLLLAEYTLNKVRGTKQNRKHQRFDSDAQLVRSGTDLNDTPLS